MALYHLHRDKERERSNASYRKHHPIRERHCPTCRSTFTGYGSQVYCAPVCNPKRNWRLLRLRRPLQQKAKRKILARDGWCCYLCNRPIDPERRWPHPLSASVDHVKPVSAGGTDDPSNLRATHWHCNEEKGDNLLGIEVYSPL